MIAVAYLLVNMLGTKTKQWVIVENGEAFPTIFNNREVVLEMVRKIEGAARRSRDHQRQVIWEIAECELVDDISHDISVEAGKCPLGNITFSPVHLGYYACLKCTHLKMDPDGLAVRGLHRARAKWECGQILREVRVARKLADR